MQLSHYVHVRDHSTTTAWAAIDEFAWRSAPGTSPVEPPWSPVRPNQGWSRHRSTSTAALLPGPPPLGVRQSYLVALLSRWEAPPRPAGRHAAFHYWHFNEGKMHPGNHTMSKPSFIRLPPAEYEAGMLKTVLERATAGLQIIKIFTTYDIRKYRECNVVIVIRAHVYNLIWYG